MAADQLASVDLPEPVAALTDAKLTVDGMTFGTVAYMAPEAFHGMEAVDARSDLYALGLILYEMITGRRPFCGETDVEAFQKKLETTPPPLADCGLSEPLPPQLEEITMRLLHKDAEQRIQTAQELVDALDTLHPPQSEQPASPPAAEAAERSAPQLVPGERAEPAAGAATSDEAASARAQEEADAPTAAAQPRRRPVLMVVAAVVAVGAAGLGVVALALHLARGGEGAAGDRAEQLTGRSGLPARGISPPGSAASGRPAEQLARQPHPEARTWRHRLRAAHKARDWKRAYQAFQELARVEPEAFGEPAVRTAAANTLIALAQAGLADADAMMSTLESGLGSGGPDVLFHIVQFRGGTKAQKRALAALKKPQVRSLASPVLRVVMQLREAGCHASPELLRRVVAEGDERALLDLQLRQDTCAPSNERDTAYRELEARLSAARRKKKR